MKIALMSPWGPIKRNSSPVTVVLFNVSGWGRARPCQGCTRQSWHRGSPHDPTSRFPGAHPPPCPCFAFPTVKTRVSFSAAAAKNPAVESRGAAGSCPPLAPLQHQPSSRAAPRHTPACTGPSLTLSEVLFDASLAQRLSDRRMNANDLSI